MNAGAAFAHRPPRLTSDIRASKTARKTLISSPGGSSQASSPLVGGLIGPSSGQRGALASNEGALLDRLKAEMDKEMTQLAAGSMPLDLLDLGKMAMYAAHMDSCTDVVKITAQELSEQIIADCVRVDFPFSSFYYYCCDLRCSSIAPFLFSAHF